MRLIEDAQIKALLERVHTVAVVGYSDKSDRPSNQIAEYLAQHGFDVYRVNPTLASDPGVNAEGKRIYASLADIPVPIDVVDVFRRPEHVPEVVQEAVDVGAKAIWMQLGIINEEAARSADAAGLDVVMDRCMKVESKRLLHIAAK